jgi:hypothetical protein
LIAIRGLALVLVLLAGTAQARDGVAQARDQVGIEILQYGLFRSDIVGKQRDAIGVSHNAVDNICHIATTHIVPMRLGQHIGLRYKVTGPVAGERVMLKKVVRFPAVMTPPVPARPLSMAMNFVELPVGAISYSEYALEQPWELVAGTWTFQFLEGERKLAEFSFTVTGDASAVPESTEPTCFQLSS